MDTFNTIISLLTDQALSALHRGPQLLIAVLALCLFWKVRLSRKRARQRWRVKGSYNILNHLKALPTFPRKMGYLRSIDPFLFEEVILSALDLHGWRIKRNRRYTGDGGIDGQAWYKGQHYLIQAKRYRSHVRKQHISDFDSLCRKRGALGLFVHTGKTPRGLAAAEIRHISIISGRALLDLLEGREFDGLGRHISSVKGRAEVA